MMMKPPHPGESLKEEYLIPLGMSVNALATFWRESLSPWRPVMQPRATG